MNKITAQLSNFKLICLHTILIIFTLSVSAQDLKTINGIVRNPEGPMADVSVIVKGTNRGTITGADGRFSIQARTGDWLVFSSSEYSEQQFQVDNTLSFDVLLTSNATSLNEVVVVGYGTQSKRNITGSVSKVSMKETQNLPNNNVSQALRGRVAGVQFTDNGRPGQNGTILIRGPRSLSAGNDPLIVLDGIFFNGSLIDINPNDIESMEVLKDASAAAIYGSRAANGVILITSKKGLTEKPTIRINSFFGLSEWTNKLQLLSPERYIQKSMDIRTQRGIAFDPNDLESFLTLTEAENYRNGKFIDPYEEISQQGKIHSTDISLSGRSKATNYYLSAALSQENGLIHDDQVKRLSFRVNLENSITDWLKIGTNTMFSENDQSGVPANIGIAMRQSPFGTWYRDDGSPTQFTVPEDIGASANPMYNSFLSKNESIRSNLFANFYGIIDIPKLKGLTFRVNFSNNYRWIRDYNATKQDIHLPNTNTTSASKRNWKASDWVLENILDYKWKISNDHAFDATLMYGANKFSFETTTANAEQLVSDIFDWNNLQSGTTLTNTSNAEENSGVSSMARLNYRFKNKYLLTLTARRDGSSVFAANNKYATFPSVALSWITSDEKFMDNLAFVEYLKFRASYGAVGNQAISPYQSLSLASVNNYIFGNGGPTAIGIFPSNISNANLKWETTYITNLAMDFSIFNGRIGGTFEVYDMNTKDLIVERSLPIMTGYTSIWTNLGQVNNKGLEISLNTLNIKKGQFEWRTDFVFSHNKNKIVSLYGVDTDGDGKEDDDLGNRWFIGQPINVFYDYVFDGIYQERDQLPAGFQPGFARFKDLNNDGKVDAANDRTIVGQGSIPKYRWGINNNFSFGNFQLSVFINAMRGWLGTFNRLDYYFDSIDPIRPSNMLDADWWTTENQSTTRPSLEYRRSVLGHNWYLSRDFVRIQDASLVYTLPAGFLNKHKLANMSIYISGKNLATFTDWLGTNPEVITDFPIARSYALGFRLGF